MAKSWCKVASNLDSHPKIRRAGRNGREVFLFALRRNAEPDNPVPGRLPGAMLEPWYLADQLMMPEQEAVTGVTACVTAGLLIQDGDSWLINGWDDEWGKRPMSVGERVSKHRQSKNKSDHVTDGSLQTVTVTPGNACNALDQRRSEEKRLEEKRREKKSRAGKPAAPKSGHQAAIDHFTQRYAKAYGENPKWNGPPIALISELVKQSGSDEVIARTDRMFDGLGPTWLKPPFTVAALSSQWNALVAVPPGAHPQQQSPVAGLRAGDLFDTQLQRVREAEEAARRSEDSQ